jgi:hypothetical protein
MSRASVTYDPDQLRSVERALGTKGLASSMRAAFQRVLQSDAERRRVEAQKRLIERLRAMQGLDLDKPDVLEDAWR